MKAQIAPAVVKPAFTIRLFSVPKGNDLVIDPGQQGAGEGAQGKADQAAQERDPGIMGTSHK